jgi:hypothetical protein
MINCVIASNVPGVCEVAEGDVPSQFFHGECQANKVSAAFTPCYMLWQKIENISYA